MSDKSNFKSIPTKSVKINGRTEWNFFFFSAIEQYLHTQMDAFDVNEHEKLIQLNSCCTSNWLRNGKENMTQKGARKNTLNVLIESKLRLNLKVHLVSQTLRNKYE